MALLVPAIVSGVVGAWAGGWFDDDHDRPSDVAERPIVETPVSGQPGAVTGSASLPTDPDTHCATRMQAVGSVEWTPCARVTADSVQFGVMAHNAGGRQVLRLRLGYVRTQQFAPCGAADSDVTATVEAGKTMWLTSKGCSVARVHAAVQAQVEVAASESSFSEASRSPTLHIQPDGSVKTS
ncbi:antitoxin (DNA-binding transcriptional repressor) of toxin-antitoxin stability system [Streptomyces luteogriseus]|nr:antitoxin (DNA-binding transcriptional repressor) of toxin-antitoxin stability system [Streptomyces luteogriseus]